MHSCGGEELNTTKEMEEKYKITRQTLHNWINQGLISTPCKDWRGWFRWSDTNDKEIEELLNLKEIQNNEYIPEKTIGKLNLNNRRYLGSKRKIRDFIHKVVSENTEGIRSVADIFGGTGSVADIFRAEGKKIIINDILYSNYVTYQTWFGNEEVNYEKIKMYISKLNNIEAKEDNYVSSNFGNKYFSMENAKKIGAIRERIEKLTDLNEREKSFLLTSLIYAMDKVANTVGHYDAYRHKMDSLAPLKLRVPELNRNVENEIYCMDANELVRRIKADLVYIDTPYNSRQYGDTYHLLENIVEWNKPEVMGIAKKMKNRQHIKSDYSTSKAPIVFDDLIQQIEAKYIIVSYNNMAKKGNGRSNAKISNEEIIESLQKRGEVAIFETPHQVFTTGKTNIEDHKELLYVCKINPNKKKTIINHKKYIKSAINYTGGKYKLLPQIEPLFPSSYKNFIDIFAGGGNVGINVEPKGKIYLNDIEKHVIGFYELLAITPFEEVLKYIKQIIERYELSDSKVNGYEYYGVHSAVGLGKYNKEKYIKLRSDFNNGLFDQDMIKPIVFYLLTVYGFNNQIRFNSKGEYNLPVGKRDFNIQMEQKLFDFHRILQNKEFVFSSKDFREFNEIGIDDFVYVDPPYLISTASYNENGGWNEKDELDLYNYLDKLSEKGIRWALSNVLIHKGKKNDLLANWAKKYHMNILDYHYNNSNYQSKARENKTEEVLITNY